MSLRQIASACFAALFGVSAIGADAQTWPTRPIKVIVGFTAGGATDAVARIYAQKMSGILGATIIVENRPGAGQIAAITALRNSPPDGYTLLLASGSALAQGPGMRKDLPYDPLKDFSLIGMVATAPGVVVVSPELPVRTMREFVDYVQARPGEVNYASGGYGSASHLQIEYLMSVTGTKMAHIPFKSDAEVLRELSVNRVQMSIATLQQSVPLIAAGKLRGLAVTSMKPVAGLGLPTLADAHVQGMEGLEPYTFFGLVGPAGMPGGAVARLSDAISQVSTTPEIAARMNETLYTQPATGTPASFRTFLEREIAKWAVVGRSVKLE